MVTLEEIAKTVGEHGRTIKEHDRILNEHALAMQAMASADRRLQEIMGDTKLEVAGARQDIKELTLQALAALPPVAAEQMAAQARANGILVALLGTASVAFLTTLGILVAHLFV